MAGIIIAAILLIFILTKLEEDTDLFLSSKKRYTNS